VRCYRDFLGGKGAYINLLDCFENTGIKLRPEIDKCFSKFNEDKNVNSHYVPFIYFYWAIGH
jgi:hypothetical protein